MSTVPSSVFPFAAHVRYHMWQIVNRRSVLRSVCTAIVLILCVASGCSESENARPEGPLRQALTAAGAGDEIGMARGDLDTDGIREMVAITCRRHDGAHPVGGEVVVLRLGKDGRLGVAWRHKGLNPWKLQVADVDGDGRPEVVVGAWKRSPRDPVMAKRVFVYSWNGKRLLPKWLGSRLTRRFDDFALADLNEDGWDELAALEVAPGSKHRVAVYRWRSFGFDWQGCSDERAGMDRLERMKDGLVVTGAGRRLAVDLKQGKIRLTELEGKR